MERKERRSRKHVVLCPAASSPGAAAQKDALPPARTRDLREKDPVLVPAKGRLVVGAQSGLLPLRPQNAAPHRRSPARPAPRPRRPSPLSSCTMPMVPPVLMTNTRASLTALQPGRSSRWVPHRALPREHRITAASIPAPKNRYLRREGELKGGPGAASVPPPPAGKAAGWGPERRGERHRLRSSPGCGERGREPRRRRTARPRWCRWMEERGQRCGERAGEGCTSPSPGLRWNGRPVVR